MSDHLPECADAMIPDFHNERWVCICPALRACEKRVRVNERDWRDQSFGLGYAAGVQAARDAVEALPTSVTYMGDFAIVKHVDKEVALAVIDALKEKP